MARRTLLFLPHILTWDSLASTRVSGSIFLVLLIIVSILACVEGFFTYDNVS